VLGIGDDWSRDQQTLGGLREAVAARSTAPILLVRGHGQRRRFATRKAKGWLADTGETDALAARTATAEGELPH